MSDNDTLFWRMLALFQSLPDLQPAQIVDWLAQECGETLTPARNRAPRAPAAAGRQLPLRDGGDVPRSLVAGDGKPAGRAAHPFTHRSPCPANAAAAGGVLLPGWPDD